MSRRPSASERKWLSGRTGRRRTSSGRERRTTPREEDPSHEVHLRAMQEPWPDGGTVQGNRGGQRGFLEHGESRFITGGATFITSGHPDVPAPSSGIVLAPATCRSGANRHSIRTFLLPDSDVGESQWNAWYRLISSKAVWRNGKLLATLVVVWVICRVPVRFFAFSFHPLLSHQFILFVLFFCTLFSFLWCIVLTCPILSCVLFFPVLSCPVLFWSAFSCPALSCVLSSPAPCSPVLFCFLSCPLLSCLLLCPVLSCPALFYPLLLCPVLYCPVL